MSRVTSSLRHQRRPQRGYEFSRRHVPAELIVEWSGLRYTSPALTALDLCSTLGGDAIDQALRTRATTLTELHRAMELTAARVGNRAKRQLLLDSRAEPWSRAERFFHRLLRDARITGWRANRPVVLRGSRFFVDVIFRELKLVIEIDGRLYHDGTRGVRERSRASSRWYGRRSRCSRLWQQPDASETSCPSLHEIAFVRDA